jgi:hypothetical protein
MQRAPEEMKNVRHTEARKAVATVVRFHIVHFDSCLATGEKVPCHSYQPSFTHVTSRCHVVINECNQSIATRTLPPGSPPPPPWNGGTSFAGTISDNAVLQRGECLHERRNEHGTRFYCPRLGPGSPVAPSSTIGAFFMPCL